MEKLKNNMIYDEKPSKHPNIYRVNTIQKHWKRNIKKAKLLFSKGIQRKFRQNLLKNEISVVFRRYAGKIVLRLSQRLCAEFWQKKIEKLFVEYERKRKKQNYNNRLIHVEKDSL